MTTFHLYLLQKNASSQYELPSYESSRIIYSYSTFSNTINSQKCKFNLSVVTSDYRWPPFKQYGSFTLVGQPINKV